MEKHKALYWRHYRIWIFGLLVSFPLAGLSGYLLNDQNPEWVVPLGAAILFFPFVVFGVHGLRYGYSMGWRYGWIWRGRPAVYSNIATLILYLAIVAGMILMDWS